MKQSTSFWPGTRTPRSQNNAFAWSGESSVFANVQRHADQRAESARRVEAKRAAGIKVGTIYGLSKKADRRREEA